jgi:hypothetical protein
MRPERADIAAPELPPRVWWLNAEEPPAMATLTANGPVLVHFFDFAQLNSVRALPYVNGWRDRYAPHGLAVLGVHSPRYPFGADRGVLAEGIVGVGVHHPVADDSEYALWHDYGCRGWPSLFLWARGGALRWYHFGEGEYAATETAIQDELRLGEPDLELPGPLAPLRPSDAPGALVAPPSEEVLPGGSATEPWRADGPGDAIDLEYAAGGAHATVAGRGELAVGLDGGAAESVVVEAPALYDLAIHPRHERHRLRLEPRGEIEVYSVGFSAGVP